MEQAAPARGTTIVCWAFPAGQPDGEDHPRPFRRCMPEAFATDNDLCARQNDSMLNVAVGS